MRRANLQPRDGEVLRTLARLRYVTTSEIAEAFFGAPRVARRRLQILSGWNLIRPHTRGLSPKVHYSAWRLTPAGLAAVREGFPDEPLPDGLGERLPTVHLTNLDHREELDRLYLQLVCGEGERVDDDLDVRAVKLRMAWVRARASQFWWQADGDVVLRSRTLMGEEHVVPDATLCGRYRHVRVFLELDRSTNALTRIEDVLRRYARHLRDTYAVAFPDRREPAVLFAVKSEARREHLMALARRILGTSVRWAVLLTADTRVWLEELIFDQTQLPASPSAQTLAIAQSAPTTAPKELPIAGDLYAAARAAYLTLHAYRNDLRRAGSDLPLEVRNALRALHRQLEKPNDDDAAC